MNDIQNILNDAKNSAIINPQNIGAAANELHKLMQSMFAEEKYNRENGIVVAPDTTGADFFLLLGFMTPDMRYDFPVIEQDFMAHCGNKTSELNMVAWYDEAYVGIVDPHEVAYKHILRLIYNGAKINEPYCTELLKKLYKTYHKKEYNRLKKYSKISPNDIFDIVDETLDLVGQEYANARILCMAQYFNIELHDDCALMYKMYGVRRDAYHNIIKRAVAGIELDEASMQEAASQINHWYEQVESDKTLLMPYRDILNITNEFFHEQGFTSSYDKLCIDLSDGGRIHMVETLAILKKIYPNRTFTFAETQIYTQVRDLILALTNVANGVDIDIDMLLGEEINEEILKNTRYKPLSIAFSEAQDNQKATTTPNTATVSKGDATSDDYLRVIDELRTELNRSRSDYKALREDYDSCKKDVTTLNSVIASLESDRDELIHLRNFAYNATSSDEVPFEMSANEMKNKLMEKNILIIGGHSNWHRKVKETFSNWKCIAVKKFSTLNPSITESYDMVFFFTEYIKHAEYYHFTSYMSKHDVNMGIFLMLI